MNWAKIDANFWTSPKVEGDAEDGSEGAGFWGGVVFQALLLLNRAHQCNGFLPLSLVRPGFLAKHLKLDEAHHLSGEAPPSEIMRQALRAAQAARLIVLEAGGARIVGWDASWSDSGSAERMRRFRQRHVTSRDGGDEHRHGDACDAGDDRREEKRYREKREESVPDGVGDVTSRDVTGVTGRSATELERDAAAWAEAQLPASSDGLTVAGLEGELGGIRQGKDKRPRKEKPEPPIEALTMANLLIAYIIENAPGSRLEKATDSQRAAKAAAWADAFRLLHDRDGIEWGVIEGMIHWCQRDAFWSGVILSGDKFREKWDTLTAQRGKRSGAGPQAAPGVGRSDPAPHKDYGDGEAAV